MISVEVHSNNVLTVSNDFFANAVSDSIKHETVKFLFTDNWKDYQKTAVFTADGVEPVCIVLDTQNYLCLSEDECYIPYEVLQGNSFNLSVFGIKGDSRATSTTVRIEVFESGYTLGEEAIQPTPDQYSQLIDAFTTARQMAESVRNDADAGLFNGKKGEKGDKGDKGEKGDKGDNGIDGKDGINGKDGADGKDGIDGKDGADGVGRKTESGGEVFNGCADNAAIKNAHAEGDTTTANGNAAHSEGKNTTASGVASHAEGNTTNAYADYSHSSGNHTRADFVGQTAVGRFNAKPNADSVFTVGNGTADNNRKNAFNVFADGHAEIQAMGESDNSVATKHYVDGELATFDFIKVVDALPQEGLLNRIYLVPSATTTQQNLFDEYIWLQSGWEYITSKQVEVDLTNYYEKSQVDEMIEEIQGQFANITDTIYPVGCTFMTSDAQINPEDLFGGIWQRKTLVKTIGGRIAVEGFSAGQTKSTTVSGLAEHKFLADNKLSFQVTPYSGAAGSISSSAGNIISEDGYLTSFDVITKRVDAVSFTAFWTITGKADVDENGNYHWVRTQ